jgi:putative transposase
MKKTRFTEERMVTTLRKDGQRPVPEVAKKHDVRAATIYEYRRRYGRLKTQAESGHRAARAKDAASVRVAAGDA